MTAHQHQAQRRRTVKRHLARLGGVTALAEVRRPMIKHEPPRIHVTASTREAAHRRNPHTLAQAPTCIACGSNPSRSMTPKRIGWNSTCGQNPLSPATC